MVSISDKSPRACFTGNMSLFTKFIKEDTTSHDDDKVIELYALLEAVVNNLTSHDVTQFTKTIEFIDRLRFDFGPVVNSWKELWSLVDSGKCTPGMSVRIESNEDEEVSDGIRYYSKIVIRKMGDNYMRYHDTDTVFIDDEPLPEEERIYRDLPNGDTHMIRVQYLERYIATIHSIQ